MLAETYWPILRFSKEKTLPGHNRRHKCTVSVAAILTFVHPEQKTSFRKMLQFSKPTSSETWRLSDWKLLYRHGVISLTAAVLPLWQSQICYFLWEISGTHMSDFGSPVFEVCSTWGSHLSRYAIGHLQKEAAAVSESLCPLRNAEGGQASPYARRKRRARKGRKRERNLWNVSG